MEGFVSREFPTPKSLNSINSNSPLWFALSSNKLLTALLITTTVQLKVINGQNVFETQSTRFYLNSSLSLYRNPKRFTKKTFTIVTFGFWTLIEQHSLVEYLQNAIKKKEFISREDNLNLIVIDNCICNVHNNLNKVNYVFIECNDSTHRKCEDIQTHRQTELNLKSKLNENKRFVISISVLKCRRWA